MANKLYAIQNIKMFFHTYICHEHISITPHPTQKRHTFPLPNRNFEMYHKVHYWYTCTIISSTTIVCITASNTPKIPITFYLNS